MLLSFVKIQELTPFTSRVSWELGMYMDADAALDDIDPFCQHLLLIARVLRGCIR